MNMMSMKRFFENSPVYLKERGLCTARASLSATTMLGRGEGGLSKWLSSWLRHFIWKRCSPRCYLYQKSHERSANGKKRFTSDITGTQSRNRFSFQTLTNFHGVSFRLGVSQKPGNAAVYINIQVRLFLTTVCLYMWRQKKIADLFLVLFPATNGMYLRESISVLVERDFKEIYKTPGPPERVLSG